jgi:hypothetical protein
VSPVTTTNSIVGETERERPWSPWRYLHTAHRDVLVYEAELPGDLLAWVDLDRRMIWLDSRLTQAEKRSSLAHEIGHLERGSCCDPAREAAEEQVVEEWAARRLIDAHALARALQWSRHLDEVADELWVDEHLVRARLRTLTDAEQDVVLAALDRHLVT